MKIDERTSIPIGWVVGVLATTLGAVTAGAVAGTSWVSAINYRLQRIEEKLGIPPYRSSVDFVSDAYAGPKQHEHKNH